jgi:hypothetical protein
MSMDERSMNRRRSRRVAILAVLIAIAGAGDGAIAGQSFEGRWFIDASCSSLFCPIKHKRLIAHVHDGRIARIEGLPGEAKGLVNPDGGVAISVRLFSITAHIWGRINETSGSGDWSSDSAICSRGAWRAVAGR